MPIFGKNADDQKNAIGNENADECRFKGKK